MRYLVAWNNSGQADVSQIIHTPVLKQGVHTIPVLTSRQKVSSVLAHFFVWLGRTAPSLKSPGMGAG